MRSRCVSVHCWQSEADETPTQHMDEGFIAQFVKYVREKLDNVSPAPFYSNGSQD